jgi:hypothetical protein
MKQQASFGLNIHDDGNCKYVLSSDIQKLPFYATWLESSRGKTCLLLDDDCGIYIHDWENFCKKFIEINPVRPELVEG